MWKLLCLAMLLLPIAAIEKCGKGLLSQPPCDDDYEMRECSLPASDNQTEVVQQCYKETSAVKTEYNYFYGKWQFWLGLMLSLGVVFGGIIFWRCIRYTEWYAKAKDNLRHEKNRVCARMCVKYCCRCRMCVKCCEPYTSATAKEIQTDRESRLDGQISHRSNNHHHVPTDRSYSVSAFTTSGSQHQTSNKPAPTTEKRTLEEVSLSSIHIA